MSNWRFTFAARMRQPPREGLVWERARPATKEGLLDLLLETRRVIKCLQHGPCATCVARDPPQHNMRLTPEGGCVTCVLKTFLQA